MFFVWGLPQRMVAVQDPHVGVLSLKLFQPFGCAVGGAVIHNHHLGGRSRAPAQNAVEAPFNVLHVVVGGYYDGIVFDGRRMYVGGDLPRR